MDLINRIFLKGDKALYMELSAINIKRMIFMSLIMGLINIAHIIVFWLDFPSSPRNVVQWHQLIILIHASMLVVNGIFCFACLMIEKRQRQRDKIALFVQGLCVFFNLLFGIFLCVSDQLVTTNINPLLVACIGVGVVVLIPPAISAVFYLVTFVLFYYLVTLTQHVPDLLEHVRVNSVTATGMGFGVSWILWKNNVLRAKQQKVIENQKRELEEKNKYLEYLATRDPLTKLYNRDCFKELVNKEINRTNPQSEDACIVLLDLDFFKDINDNFGHPAGDMVIQETARIIIHTFRDSDITGRLGGEEFIILLPQTDTQAGKEIAEKLRKNIEDYSFQFEGHHISVTASKGIARLKDSFEICYREADEALYAAKKNGRNCVEVSRRAFINI
ncbi:GGDEF domain-containing protein [Bacillus sp. DNRA2]|uniref:GGDEF domain-containing protein n=1 Tax=Bacillus sp. DNRA2 TaxID=2723053 RepID=UPI00145F6991|nr:GGDEF domain-containing protein [Bacillus sp. DNRA2]NMD69809.1 GGDEF domain-containing protein [Bacillus sp. DNRA2]